MNKSSQQIKCPNCGQEIDVNEILYHKLEEEIKLDYNQKLLDQKKDYESKFGELEKLKAEIEKEKKELGEKVEKSVNEKLKSEKRSLEQKLRNEIAEEKEGEINSYKEQLEQKIKEAKDLNTLKADHEKLKREKDELKEKYKAEAEIKISEKVLEEKKKITKEIEDKNQLKLADKEHLISQLTEQLKEAQRKAEQGSMQAQGEVQEIAIEGWLKYNFVLDEIQEVKKGARGADCLQIINTPTFQNCGSIYYESKRTKDFQKSWIEKFKNDMRLKGADVGVIVTDAMPKEMERMGLYEGIWVCSLDEFKGLCFVLRESVIHIYNASKSQENKGDKMNMLYSYLTSNEFKMQIEAIVEGFVQLKNDLDSEKRSMEGIWKKREKQIEKVLLNTNHMYNSFKGIAGSAIAPIKYLELPDPESQ
jgi:hypothetical protein